MPFPHRICPARVSPRTPRIPGVGDYLHRILKRLTGEAPTAKCGCENRIARMNAWGPGGCREHLEEIVDWLMAEADKHGWRAKAGRRLGGRFGCRQLVRLAIWLAERATAEPDLSAS